MITATAIGGNPFPRSGRRLLRRLPALFVLAVVACVFIAPSVDLLDSTCSLDGISLTQLPRIPVPSFSYLPAIAAPVAVPERIAVVSHRGSEVREATCSLLC
jgi:hypothetical protein